MTDAGGKGKKPPKRDTEVSELRPSVAPRRSDAISERGRVDLDFHAPPLRLPQELVGDATLVDTISPAHTREAFISATEPPPATATSPAPAPIMDIPEDVHDAWTVERVERGGSVPLPTDARGSTRPPSTDTEVPPEGAAPSEELGNALDLVDRASPTNPGHNLESEMMERFALGDFTGALHIAELVLGKDPTSPSAREYGEACRVRLAQLYASRVGGLHRVPSAVTRESTVLWLGLDHRAATLLKRVNGTTTCDALIVDSGMPELDALKALVELLDAGAIQFEQ